MDKKLYSVKVLMDTSITPNRDYETVLEAVARKIPSERIYCINFDSEYAIYELYLSRILDMITLLRDGIEICGVKIPICPSYDAFLISGVYPFIENSTLCELFRKFGNVSRISDIRVSPDTPKFSHIKSGFRQVELSIPGREENVCLPSIITAVVEGFSVLFTIKKLCYICMSLGHDTVKCPGLRTSKLTKIKNSLLANNEIASFDDFNFMFKEDIDEERKTATNEEKSGNGIKKSVEEYKYLSVQSPGRLTASHLENSAVHSDSDMLLTDDKHYGNESCDISDKLTNMNTYRGEKRKHSSPSTSTNDQNLSEVSNVACLNIRNEVINSNVPLIPKNCLSLSVSDDSGGQFKKLYSLNYCARCKEELEFVGNNFLPQSSEEIASNKVSKNVLSEIQVKNSGLEAQSAENLSTVRLSSNENFELQNQSSNVIVDVISHLDDGVYVGEEESLPKNDKELKIIHCVREDLRILPENTNELKSSNVHSIQKVHESFLKNTDELGSTSKLNVGQSKEEILSTQLSRRDPLPRKNIYELSRYANVTTVPLSINESYEPQNQSSNISSDVMPRSDDIIYKEEQEKFPKNNKLKIADVYSVGEDHISLPENTKELINSDVHSIKTVHESFENNDEFESMNRFNIKAQSEEEILSFQSSLSIQPSDVTDASASGCTNEVVNYSAIKNLTNNASFSKHHSVDLTEKSHQIQLSDSKRWNPLPWKEIDELSRNDADESSTCSSASLPSVEELLKLVYE